MRRCHVDKPISYWFRNYADDNNDYEDKSDVLTMERRLRFLPYDTEDNYDDHNDYWYSNSNSHSNSQGN